MGLRHGYQGREKSVVPALYCSLLYTEWLPFFSLLASLLFSSFCSTPPCLFSPPPLSPPHTYLSSSTVPLGALPSAPLQRPAPPRCARAPRASGQDYGLVEPPTVIARTCVVKVERDAAGAHPVPKAPVQAQRSPSPSSHGAATRKPSSHSYSSACPAAASPMIV
ncbi:hypothetical protein B0H11DRAFT_2266324 [Mycena galericulata]|nr:hypothetical protein B0H11DRAFT_2266324 [Mycena galericulata]